MPKDRPSDYAFVQDGGAKAYPSLGLTRIALSNAYYSVTLRCDGSPDGLEDPARLSMSCEPKHVDLPVLELKTGLLLCRTDGIDLLQVCKIPETVRGLQIAATSAAALADELRRLFPKIRFYGGTV